MKIETLPVWKQVTPALAQELVGFWRGNRAIGSDEAAAARAMQAVCVARDADGALCGVATAVVKVLPRLRQPMYYYRQYFAPALRGQRQERAFYLAAKRLLQDYNATLPQAESLGILLELENAKIASAYPRAHEPAVDVTFIGYSPRGLQLRVSYFEGARLLPPAPLRAPVPATRDSLPGPGRIPPASRQRNGRT